MNKNILAASLFSISFAVSLTASSDVTCVAGKPGSTSLIDQLNKAKGKGAGSSKITRIIYDQYQLEKTEAVATAEGCTTCGNALSKIDEPIKEVPSTLFPAHKAPKRAFKDDCLTTSTKSSSATAAQISCPSGAAEKNMCVTQEQLTYQNAVISSFVSCAAKVGMSGINLNAIFQKLSIESGFRPQYSSGNGTGLGQLTPIFVKDVNGRGRKYMENIAKNKSSECAAATLIAQSDLEKNPKTKLDKSAVNRCAFISTGEGLERNILYSLIGTTTVWEMDLEPKMRKYLNNHSQDPDTEEVKKLTVMNAYGRGGAKGALSAFYRLEGETPSEFARLMQLPMYGKTRYSKDGKKSYRPNLTEYTSNIKKRQDSIGKNLPDSLKSDFAKNGANACINTY